MAIPNGYTRAIAMKKIWLLRELKVALVLHDKRVQRAQERLERAVARRSKAAEKFFKAERDLLDAAVEGIC